MARSAISEPKGERQNTHQQRIQTYLIGKQ